MYTKFSHRDETAWAKGDMAYEIGDTLETGAIKAAQEGIKPCSDSYAAFMTAFGRRVRIKEVSPKKRPINIGNVAQVGAEPTQAVWRAAS